MDVRRIIADIDAEIAKLQGVKATLTGLSTTTATASDCVGWNSKPGGHDSRSGK